MKMTFFFRLKPCSRFNVVVLFPTDDLENGVGIIAHVLQFTVTLNNNTTYPLTMNMFYPDWYKT